MGKKSKKGEAKENNAPRTHNSFAALDGTESGSDSEPSVMKPSVGAVKSSSVLADPKKPSLDDSATLPSLGDSKATEASFLGGPPQKPSLDDKTTSPSGHSALFDMIAALQRKVDDNKKEMQRKADDDKKESDNKNQILQRKVDDLEKMVSSLDKKVTHNKVMTTRGEFADTLEEVTTDEMLAAHPQLQWEANILPKGQRKRAPVNRLHKLQKLPSYNGIYHKTVREDGDIQQGDLRRVGPMMLICAEIKATETI